MVRAESLPQRGCRSGWAEDRRAYRRVVNGLTCVCADLRWYASQLTVPAAATTHRGDGRRAAGAGDEPQSYGQGIDRHTARLECRSTLERARPKRGEAPGGVDIGVDPPAIRMGFIAGLDYGSRPTSPSAQGADAATILDRLCGCLFADFDIEYSTFRTTGPTAGGGSGPLSPMAWRDGPYPGLAPLRPELDCVDVRADTSR